MAVEEGRVDAGFSFAGFIVGKFFFVAGFVGAFGIDFANEKQLFAVGEEGKAGGFGGNFGDGLGAGAVRVHHPDLGGAAAVRDVGNFLGIGGPAGSVVVAFGGEDEGGAAVEGDSVDLTRLFILG